VEGAILGKLARRGFYEYLGLNADNGLNKHIMIYGASGSGKSRGFIKPFILKTAKLMQSMIIVDPKAEMAEQMAEYLKEEGYVVKMFNLLDMENSDAWNCLGEIDGDIDMVQSVAEVIIRNTSEEGQKADFWDKAEKNLLVALIHYVYTLKDPVTGELLYKSVRLIPYIICYRMTDKRNLTQKCSVYRLTTLHAHPTEYLNRLRAIFGEIFLSV